tara:strand:+ start:1954 stop:2355 length:402 start_codon:yes stop_codon:yes gene_type:complete
MAITETATFYALQVGNGTYENDKRERKQLTDDEKYLIKHINWALKIGEGGSSTEKHTLKFIEMLIMSGLTTAAIGVPDVNTTQRYVNLLENRELLNALAREIWWGEEHIDLENGEILLSEKCYGFNGSYEEVQ